MWEIPQVTEKGCYIGQTAGGLAQKAPALVREREGLESEVLLAGPCSGVTWVDHDSSPRLTCRTGYQH